MNRPLNILMVCHMPWDPNAGGSRVQLELAAEMERLGHRVEKFSYEDAFPQVQGRLGQLTADFSQKARQFVRANAHRFDIIDAHQGNLPFTKQQLGFQGLLVARTVGLYVFVDEFLTLERQRWGTARKSLKGKLGDWFVSWMHQKSARACYPSLQACDVINVPNRDEQIYVRDHLGLGEKCAVFPFGLSGDRQTALEQAIQPPEVRLQQQEIVFIGGWQTRKGSKDWAEIIRRVRLQVPTARFLFLGTGLDKARILENLQLPDCEWIRSVPTYASHELPTLLSQATVGAFPSYMEGFGFAVLEKLACGLPTVAYDVPGPREMLGLLEGTYLTPVGEVQPFCDRLVQLLQLDAASYAKISADCVAIARQFSWAAIAESTLSVYTQFLQRQQVRQ